MFRESLGLLFTVCALMPAARATEYHDPSALGVQDQVMALGDSMAAKGLGSGFTLVGGQVKWGDYRIVLCGEEPGKTKTSGKAPSNPLSIAMNVDYWFDGLLDPESWESAMKAFALMVHEKAHQDLKGYWGGGYCTEPGCFTAVQAVEECLGKGVVNGTYDQNPCHEAYAESKEAKELCDESCRKEDGVFVHSEEERESLQAAAVEAAGEACDFNAKCEAAVAQCLGDCDAACADAFDPQSEPAELADCSATCTDMGTDGMPFPAPDDPLTPGADVPPGDCPTTPDEGWSCSCEQG